MESTILKNLIVIVEDTNAESSAASCLGISYAREWHKRVAVVEIGFGEPTPNTTPAPSRPQETTKLFEGRFRGSAYRYQFGSQDIEDARYSKIVDFAHCTTTIDADLILFRISSTMTKTISAFTTFVKSLIIVTRPDSQSHINATESIRALAHNGHSLEIGILGVEVVSENCAEIHQRMINYVNTIDIPGIYSMGTVGLLGPSAFTGNLKNLWYGRSYKQKKTPIAVKTKAVLAKLAMKPYPPEYGMRLSRKHEPNAVANHMLTT